MPSSFRNLPLCLIVLILPCIPTARAATPEADWSSVRPSDQPFNLVLLSLDTTRQDRLSCYGFEKPTTPNLDRLAREGILFQRAAAPVPVTLPSHATMVTGLYPFEHEVRHNGAYVLADSFPTLAEMLQEHGYDTGMIAGAFPLDHRFGLDQGFAHYDDRFSALSTRNEGDTAQRPASEVTRLALQWIDQPRDKPFFLWAHYFDPHAPYRPPEPFAGRFPGDPYAGEVAFMDSEIGRLTEGLRSRGLLERTVIVVAGDHGEGLGEHGEPTHSMFIYGSTQWVPLIVRLPDVGPFGDERWRNRQVTDLTSLADILPTAWNALGLPRHELPPVTGRSLLPVAAGQSTGHEWLYHETLVPDLDYGMSELRGLQTDSWKYIRAPRPELYNLDKDPKELMNLAEKEPKRVREMEETLSRILAGEKSAGAPVAMDPETLEKLRSLGYLGGASGVGETRADPKDLAGVGRASSRAQSLAERHRVEEAVTVLDSLLREQPRTRIALRLRGLYLTRLGRGDEAVSAYEAALDDCDGCPYETKLRQERADAFVAAGRLNDARKEVESLLASNPRGQGLHLTLAQILESQGDAAAARREYRRESEFFPREPLPWVRLGMLEAAQNRTAEAESAYRQALSIDPEEPDAMVMLSELLEETDRRAAADSLLDRALSIDPAHPGARYHKAWRLRDQGRKEEAVIHYQAALQIEPKNGQLWYQLGTLYGELNRSDEAARCYEMSIRTGDPPAGALANLGVLHAQAGRLPQAVELWRQALDKDPDGPAAAALRSNLQRAEQMMKAQGGER